MMHGPINLISSTCFEQIIFHHWNSCFFLFFLSLFPCFFLSCKANTGVYLAKAGHGPHSSQLVNCVVLCILCVYMCTVLLQPRGNPIAVKHIISYHIIIYHIISYHIIYHIISHHIIPYHIIYIIYLTTYHIISYHIYHILSLAVRHPIDA